VTVDTIRGLLVDHKLTNASDPIDHLIRNHHLAPLQAFCRLGGDARQPENPQERLDRETLNENREYDDPERQVEHPSTIRKRAVETERQGECQCTAQASPDDHVLPAQRNLLRYGVAYRNQQIDRQGAADKNGSNGQEYRTPGTQERIDVYLKPISRKTREFMRKAT
jgi:hypothetical protein